MLTEQDLSDLKSAAKEGPVAWNKVCDKIKAKFNGYPTDWYEKVIASGLIRLIVY